jgi:hypothetical protein
MPDTLLQVTQRLARKVRIDSTFTNFSSNDETLDLIAYINDAYQDLLDALPLDFPFLMNTSQSIALNPGQRLYNLAENAHQWSLLSWSFNDMTDGTVPLESISLETLQANVPNYTSNSGKPSYVYLEGNDQVGFYPVPDSEALVSYKFSQSFVRVSNPTDTFLIPDNWLRFVEDQAKYYYDLAKGFTDAIPADARLISILAEAELMTPHFFGF